MNKSDREYLRKTNLRLERGEELKDEKKKGSSPVKVNDPKRMANAKRLFNSKKDELKSQQGQLLLRFLETYPSADATLQCCEMVWSFLTWLKEKGYLIVHDSDLLVAPFSKFAKLKDLK